MADVASDVGKQSAKQLPRASTGRLALPPDAKAPSDIGTRDTPDGAKEVPLSDEAAAEAAPKPLAALSVQIGNPSGPPLAIHSGACCIPHVDRTHTGGEDAHFISTAGLGAVGVADGVGSWSEDGVDPAEYSRLLMACCKAAVEETKGQADAVRVLQYAQEHTNVAGSSTACIALLRPGGLMEVGNVGDSGLRVIRGDRCAFATEAQEHDFNQPFQLAHPQQVAFTDLATDAQITHVQLREGDVVVLGSDGLFNNMWDKQLVEIVSHRLQHLRGGFSPEAAQQLARELAAAAHSNAKKKFFRSPFGVEAASRGLGSLMFRLLPLGGKMDDTTVVVCLVAKQPEGQQQDLAPAEPESTE